MGQNFPSTYMEFGGHSLLGGGGGGGGGLYYILPQ